MFLSRTRCLLCLAGIEAKAAAAEYIRLRAEARATTLAKKQTADAVHDEERWATRLSELGNMATEPPPPMGGPTDVPPPTPGSGRGRPQGSETIPHTGFFVFKVGTGMNVTRAKVAWEALNQEERMRYRRRARVEGPPIRFDVIPTGTAAYDIFVCDEEETALRTGTPVPPGSRERWRLLPRWESQRYYDLVVEERRRAHAFMASNYIAAEAKAESNDPKYYKGTNRNRWEAVERALREMRSAQRHPGAPRTETDMRRCVFLRCAVTFAVAPYVDPSDGYAPTIGRAEAAERFGTSYVPLTGFDFYALQSVLDGPHLRASWAGLRPTVKATYRHDARRRFPLVAGGHRTSLFVRYLAMCRRDLATPSDAASNWNLMTPADRLDYAPELLPHGSSLEDFYRYERVTFVAAEERAEAVFGVWFLEVPRRMRYQMVREECMEAFVDLWAAGKEVL